MPDLYNSICITSVAATVCGAMGVECGPKFGKANPVVSALVNKKLGGKKADRAVLYNPDAVALWLYQKYTEKFTDAVLESDLALPMLSVMPSVTPVCFGSMYTGVMPEIHGIKKYVKPVLKIETIFDMLIKAGKRPVIVSTEGDSISKIFLEREMDYFIYDTIEEVNKKALSLIDEDIYDLIVIYNGNYDGTMHREGTESPEALAALEENLAFYTEIIRKIKAQWKNHNVIYGFLPDHGCHDVDSGSGSHGLDMEEDMNVVHLYGAICKE